MSSLDFLCPSSYYRSVLLPRYEPVPLSAFVEYVQIILNGVTQASPQLMSHLIYHVCHRSGYGLFLCDHKSIVACASELCLLVGYVAF
jgi:hypothetical protein